MTNRNIAVTLECFIKKGNKYLMLHRSPKKRIMPADYASGNLRQKIEDGEFVWLTKNQILRQKNLLAELKHLLPNC